MGLEENCGFEEDLTKLKRINEQYPIILIDTSAISTYLSSNPNNGNEKEKTNINRLGISSAEFVIKYLQRGGNIFITPNIEEENCPKSKYKFKKSIKKMDRAPKKQRKNLLNLQRSIRESIKIKKKMINLFEKKGKVLDLTQTEEYQELYSRYNFLLTHFKLSETDSDILISSVLLSRSNNTALVTNDFKIFYAGKNLCVNEKIERTNLEFFVRKPFFKLKPFGSKI